jgi:cytochrome c-type biogenesis protein CcmE
MTDATRRRLFAVLAITIAATALGFIGLSDIGDDLVYYWSPSELLASPNAQGATVRLGGMVQPGTVEWDRDAHTASFIVTDGEASVPVRVKGNPPAMFREGIGVVVEGQLGGDGLFLTERVMVKHSNEYEAPANHEEMQAAQKTLVVDDS